MSRPPIPSWYFALVIVRRGHRFLLVKEHRDGTWYLPAGRVEPGESLAEAARRETLEEAAVPIVLEGVLRVEHTVVKDGGARVRVFFVARPLDDTPPKTVADAESDGAAWVTMEDLARLPLRGPEVRWILQYVADGGQVYSLDVLTHEGKPWRR